MIPGWCFCLALNTLNISLRLLLAYIDSEVSDVILSFALPWRRFCFPSGLFQNHSFDSHFLQLNVMGMCLFFVIYIFLRVLFAYQICKLVSGVNSEKLLVILFQICLLFFYLSAFVLHASYTYAALPQFSNILFVAGFFLLIFLCFSILQTPVAISPRSEIRSSAMTSLLTRPSKVFVPSATALLMFAISFLEFSPFCSHCCSLLPHH